MHLLTAASLKNRALIALVTIVAAVFGLLGVGSLKQELMPSVQFPAVAVVTSYPGASPEVVNNEVSEPIETALRGVPDLESTTATSSTGASMVLAEFTYGVDTSVTEQRAERAISRISQQLPEAVDPQVTSGSIDDFPVIQVAVTPPAEGDPEETGKLIERLALPELSDLDGVREAQLSGARGDRITIAPDADELEDNGLTSQSVTDALQQSGVLVAAGTVTDGDHTLAVQAGSELDSVEEIEELPLPLDPAALAEQQAQIDAQGEAQQFPDTAPPGDFPPGDEPSPPAPEQPAPEPLEVVSIGDVAEVSLEPNPEESIARVNGEAALTIGITKMSAANTVDVSHAVIELLPELEESLEGATLSIVFDQAPYVEESIETLTTEGLLGLVFAVLVILAFLLSVRATLVTAISIPTSILFTFIGLNFAEYTLNMLTLGALTISIGRVVDDSIVVIENIKRHLIVGADRAATIVRAVREVAGAITSSTVTTMAVFLPMAFVGDMVGELFRPFAFTAAIALAASLLVSLTIVPVLAYWFLKPEGTSKRPRFLQRLGVPEVSPGGVDPERVTPLQRGYRPIINWTLRRPIVTMLITAVVFGGTLALSPLMKTNFMGDDEQNSVGLVQTLEPGTSLDAQLAQAEQVEEQLDELDEVDIVQVSIGGGGDGMAAIFGGGGDGTINYSITTDPDAVQGEAQEQIRAAVESLDDAGEFSLGMSDGGVTMSSAIEVYVTAPDQETLGEASEAVVAELRDQPDLVQIESDLAQSRPYLRIEVDREEAAEFGLTEAAVAGMVADRMQPAQIGEIVIEPDTVDVYLAEGTAPDDQEGVEALLLPTPSGEERLDSLATVEVADGPVTLRTENAVRMVTVSALPEGDDLTSAGAAVATALEEVSLPGGANASIGGVLAQQEEAFMQLGIALLVAILIVYVVMVATFKSLLQPLLLLVSVPLATTGAILLLLVTGIPLGVPSLIGVLMLIGVVVTNAIVLIDLVNQRRRQGEPLREAVERGSLLRLRPIVMTALATILALTPMGLGVTGKGGFISQPLAVVVIGGLFSSTFLTLIVLPTLYYAVERRREARGDRRARRRRGGPGSGSGGAEAVVAGAAAVPGVGAPAAGGVRVGSVEDAGDRVAGGGIARAGDAEADLVDETAGPIGVEPFAETPAETPAEKKGRRRRRTSRARHDAGEPGRPGSAQVPESASDTASFGPASESALPGASAPGATSPDPADQPAPGLGAFISGGLDKVAPIVEELPPVNLVEPAPQTRHSTPTEQPAGGEPMEAGPAAPHDVAPEDLGVPEKDETEATSEPEISDELADLLQQLGLPATSAWEADDDQGEQGEEERNASGGDRPGLDTVEDGGAEASGEPTPEPEPEGQGHVGSGRVEPEQETAAGLSPSRAARPEPESAPARPAEPTPSESERSSSEPAEAEAPVAPRSRPAAPITGELNWNELMWQALRDTEPQAVPDAVDEPEPGTGASEADTIAEPDIGTEPEPDSDSRPEDGGQPGAGR